MAGAAVEHPAGPMSAAWSLAQMIAARAPGWEFRVEGMAWIASDPDPDYARWVMVDATTHLFADPADARQPRPWRSGPLVAGYHRDVEIRIQLPPVTDFSDLARSLAALVAAGALPAPARDHGHPGRVTGRQGDVGDWMQTYTGRAFWPLAPCAEDVDPADIAHALALLCRYGGHVNRFYSVAEHCVLMSQAVAPENALWALLHDATEAYMGDMVRPIKRAMPAYATAEDRLMAVICDRFGLGYDCPAEVKAADNRILRDERDALMAPAPLPWSAIEQVPALGVEIEGWPPAEAERRYLARLHELESA